MHRASLPSKHITARHPLFSRTMHRSPLYLFHALFVSLRVSRAVRHFPRVTHSSPSHLPTHLSELYFPMFRLPPCFPTHISSFNIVHALFITISSRALFATLFSRAPSVAFFTTQHSSLLLVSRINLSFSFLMHRSSLNHAHAPFDTHDQQSVRIVSRSRVSFMYLSPGVTRDFSNNKSFVDDVSIFDVCQANARSKCGAAEFP